MPWSPVLGDAAFGADETAGGVVVVDESDDTAIAIPADPRAAPNTAAPIMSREFLIFMGRPFVARVVNQLGMAGTIIIQLVRYGNRL